MAPRGRSGIVRAVCPKDPCHRRFETIAHVVQSWAVDAEGDFLDELLTLETAHGPDPRNIWICLECDTQAMVYELDAEGEAAVLALSGERAAAVRVEPGLRSRPSALADKRA